MRVVAFITVAMLVVTPCNAYRRKNAGTQHSRVEMTGPDWYGDSTTKLIRLDQGWTAAESDWFYWTTQGSQLLPYAFFLALEQADAPVLFRDAHNMQKYRFLPERPSPANPDGLPVGFIADAESALPRDLLTDRRSAGFTCAACHTTNINYKGTGIRVDGAAALTDIASFLIDLTAALQATVADDAKFDRFAAKVLGPAAKGPKKTSLRSTLRTIANQHSAYNTLNRSDVAEGFGRLDAFGRIFNNALVLVDPRNGTKANAPARFPQLWDTTRLDFVQWTGVASNAGIGPLMRNLGQIIGVFAAIDPGDPPPSVGYDSSVNVSNLRALEHSLKSLKSPLWPENVLPPIDHGRAAAGRELFVRDCRGCHHDIERDRKDRVLTSSVSLSTVRTDPLTAENLINSRGNTGFLEGTKQDVYFGRLLGPTDTAFHITRNTVLHIFFGKLSPGLRKKAMRRVDMTDSGPAGPTDRAAIAQHSKNEPQLQYKARPLNGIWAAAPFLHNGSVPNLYEVLLPPNQRSKQFAVGRREFDPVKVGFVPEPTEGTFLFDTTLKGNTNVGHEFGAHLSETERWQIVEYLKSL
jgi:processive rubber oxygenase RoxA-like protein